MTMTGNICKVSKEAKIRNQYNQVAHLTQDTTWESDKTQLNITHKRVKGLAFSQQVTTRLRCTDKQESMTNMKHKKQK